MTKQPEMQASELWNKYYVLSQEMLKFIDRGDVEVFLQLLEQRLAVQKLLEQLDDKAWPKSEEGQMLYQKLQPVDMQIRFKAKSWLNKAKSKNETVKAYDQLGANPAGHVFNREL